MRWIPKRATPNNTGGARRALPPYRFVSASGLLALLLAAASLAIALRQPTLGIHMGQGASRDAPPVIVSAAEGIPLIGEVLMIEGANGELFHPRSDDFEHEPDILFASYPAFNHFFERQDQLSRILRSGAVTFHGSNGGTVTMHPVQHRSIAQLPIIFWYQLLVGAGCWMCGACIWAFRRHDRAAWYMAASGFSVLLLVAAAAVYDTRELALPGTLFRTLSTINHWGAQLACGTFVAVFWHYPKRLARFDIGPWVVAAYLLVALLDALQILPLHNYGTNIALLVGGLAGSGLAILQWWTHRNDPLGLAALQWFLMSWCLGFGLFLTLVTVPALVGANSGDMQAYAFGCLLLISFGLCLGIARYRLFDFGVWWFRVILFLLGSATIILLDVALSALLNFKDEEALAVSLGLTGWLYFPLRQWLHGLIYTRIGRRSTHDLPTLLQAALYQETEAVERLIPDALQRLYAPLELKPLRQPLTTVGVTENGLALQVPGIERLPAWEARWPDHGRRLFSRFDVRTMTVVWGVLERIAAYQHAVRRGIEKERERLTQDLHDDIGARLLTLLHRHPGTVEHELRDVLQRVRATVHELGATPLTLAQCLDAWESETVERAQAVGSSLSWSQPDDIPECLPGAVNQVDLTRTLREAVSNALAHAHPTRLRVNAELPPGRLRISVEHDGVAQDATLKPGLGMRNMKKRVARLGGTLEVHLHPPFAHAMWDIPLQAWIQKHSPAEPAPQIPPLGG